MAIYADWFRGGKKILAVCTRVFAIIGGGARRISLTVHPPGRIGAPSAMP